MKRSLSSRRWLDRHFKDPYVKQAQQQGYRSRAVFKLLELDQRDRLLKPGLTLVDLGAAPGGWSQIARQRLGSSGRILALDCLPMEPLPGVDFIQGDFREAEPLAALETALQGDPVDLVLSDMAPNTTGTSAVDQPRAIYLCELALDFAHRHLRPGGHLLMKTFQGEGFEALLQATRANFQSVSARKPKASRAGSREVYILAKNHKPRNQGDA